MYLPMILQSSALILYVSTALIFFNYENSALKVLSVVAFSYLIDTIISKIFYKKVRLSITPLIVGLATCLLLKTEYLWVYLLIVSSAHISKAFLKQKERHFFNPAAFGVVFALLFLHDYVTANVNLFNGHLETSIRFFALGLFVSYMAGMLRVSLLWVLMFFVVNFFMGTFVTGVPISFFVLIALNPSFIIFSFHMITDPKTTPRNNKDLFIYVLILTVLDSLFRSVQTPNSFFFAIIGAQLVNVGLKIPDVMRKAVSFLVLISMGVTNYFVFNTKTNIPTSKLPKYLDTVNFKEVSRQLKVDFKHREADYVKNNNNVRSHIITPGISVGDINNDGWSDFVTVSAGIGDNPKIFINKEGKYFSNNEWVIKRNKDLVFSLDIAPTLFDYDNDGDLDLYISNTRCDRLYENTGEEFILVEYRLYCGMTQYAYPFDHDNDGDLDLLLLGYVKIDYDKKEVRLPDSARNATNGARNWLLLNENGKFKRVKSIYSKYEDWSFDAGIFENEDGIILAVINDFGTNRYYLNGKEYNKIKKDTRESMSFSSHYPKGSKYSETYISNVYVRSYNQEGNFLYRNNNDKAIDLGVKKCGWAWGSVFSDFNGDGYNDLYVTNGFFSADNADDFLNARKYTYEFMVKNSFSQSQRELLGLNFNPNSIKIDAGFQKDCFYLWDPKENKYINVAEESGIKEALDGRTVVTIDYDNDGDLDLIVSNQNEGIKIFQNNMKNRDKVQVIDFGKDAAKKWGTKINIDGNTFLYDYGKTGLMGQGERRIYYYINSKK